MISHTVFFIDRQKGKGYPVQESRESPSIPLPFTSMHKHQAIQNAKKKKYDHTSLPVQGAHTPSYWLWHRGVDRRTRLTEDSEVHSFCCRLYELAEVVDYSSSNGKRRKCHIRLPSTAFLINGHVLVQSTNRKHPFSLLHKDPYYVKII